MRRKGLGEQGVEGGLGFLDRIGLLDEYRFNCLGPFHKLALLRHWWQRNIQRKKILGL